MELYNATAGDGLMLVYSGPRQEVQVGTWLFFAGFGVVLLFFAFIFFRDPRSWPVLGLLIAVAAAIVYGVRKLPRVTRVVTDFDRDKREVRVTTSHSAKPEETTTVHFDNVKALFLDRYSGPPGARSRLLTLSLLTRDGRSIFLGEDAPTMFGDGLEDRVNRIRRETGVGGVEEPNMLVQAAKGWLPGQ